MAFYFMLFYARVRKEWTLRIHKAFVDYRKILKLFMIGSRRKVMRVGKIWWSVQLANV